MINFLVLLLLEPIIRGPSPKNVCAAVNFYLNARLLFSNGHPSLW